MKHQAQIHPSAGNESAYAVAAGQIVVFFDGECPFCIGWVQFTLRRDTADRIRFAALQGEWASAFFASRRAVPPDLSSLLVANGTTIVAESDAVLAIASVLPAPWSWLRALRNIPRFLRDPLYRWVARNRYKWFGKHSNCHIPSPAERAKFK